MRSRGVLAFGLVLGVQLLALGQAPTEPARGRSPLAGNTGAKGEPVEVVFPVPGEQESLTVEVFTTRWKGIATGLRRIEARVERPEGKGVAASIGPAGGTSAGVFKLPPGVQVVGVSGKHGAILDSLQLHCSDGKTSPLLGGDGGQQDYRIVLATQKEQYLGRVRGLVARHDGEALTALGVLTEGVGGAAPKLERPEPIGLVIRGEVPPEFAPTVGRMAALFYECYPPLLKRFDTGKQPAPREITLHFKRNLSVPAYCQGSEISISIDWLTRNPDDTALLTHELTHAVQAYPMFEPGWLIEGIADYARHAYGPKEQPKWSLPARLTARQSYRDSYRTTGRFLLWLESKHPGVVDHVHLRLKERAFSPADFKAFTGKSLDELWADCVAELAGK